MKLAPLSDHLQERHFVTTAFSAADVIVGGVLHWAEQVGLLKEHPSLSEYVDRLRARPAFQRADAPHT